jgi:hypothetical protein
MLTRRNVLIAAAAFTNGAAASVSKTDGDRIRIQSALLADIEAKLVGVPMEVIGSTLAVLTAKYFAGINPDIRGRLLTGFHEMVLKTIPAMEREIRAPWAPGN